MLSDKNDKTLSDKMVLPHPVTVTVIVIVSCSKAVPHGSDRPQKSQHMRLTEQRTSGFFWIVCMFYQDFSSTVGKAEKRDAKKSVLQ
jgi:hypothetical protein